MANFPFFDDDGIVTCLFCGGQAQTSVDSDRDWTTSCTCKKFKKYDSLQDEIYKLEKETSERLEKLSNKKEIANLERRLKKLKGNK